MPSLPPRPTWKSSLQQETVPFFEGTSEMHETRAVELTLDLPKDVAESVAEVARRDPEYVGRVIRHALVRRAVFQELRRSGAFGSLTSPTASTRSA